MVDPTSISMKPKTFVDSSHKISATEMVCHGMSHPDTMLKVYKGLIRSVLEYGYITFDRAFETHMLNLERN
jgi:hypothetical protein